jgi:UDP-N-acetylmuramate--alanine ligase
MQNLDNIQLSQFDKAYFIGIGGIGMSALARYFKKLGWTVAGYDKTPTLLTTDLEKEGIDIHYTDLGENVPVLFTQTSSTLVVYTPAIPKNMGELHFFQQKQIPLFKRAEVVGLITRQSKALGVAGTHGKTTTSSLLTNILSNTPQQCNAFLGGIATNFKSNLVQSDNSEYTVIEADEFDRSFLTLRPFASIITSTDPDHLDIYGDETEFLAGFQAYANLIHPAGCLVKKEGLHITCKAPTITYSLDSDTADYYGFNVRFDDGKFFMDVRTPNHQLKNIEMGLPGIHNAENALACIALTEFLGVSEETIRKGIRTFLGVKRRFEYHIKTPNLVYIDDYAHHPTEIQALLSSVKLLYPNKAISAIFQPHLFTRTRDFFGAFCQTLRDVDNLILLPIYPAREEPIPGITSEEMAKTIGSHTYVLTPEDAVAKILELQEGVVLTIGAGDIDRIIPSIKAGLL